MMTRLSRWPVGWVALAASVMLVSCTSSGLRGVGTSDRTDSISLVNDADTMPDMDPALMNGVEMTGVATDPTTEVTAFVPDEVPPAPEMATERDAAVEQIRAKAGALADEKPHVFDRGYSSVPKMTAREQDELKAELAAIAKRNERAIAPGAADRKAAQIRRLRDQAQSHYQETLDRIED